MVGRFYLAARLASVFAVTLCMAAAGCSQPAKTAAELDASELLSLLQERQHVDAQGFLEMDLGRFRITHPIPGADGPLYVQFHLFGVVPQDRQAKLNEVWPKFEKRARDSVIGLIQRTETEHLCDPGLALLKEEIAGTINHMLKQRLLVSVAFSDYSTDREAGMPWSIPPGQEPKPAPSGGHGGGHH